MATPSNFQKPTKTMLYAVAILLPEFCDFRATAGYGYGRSAGCSSHGIAFSGSLSLLLSKYPWELSNVYLGGTPKLRLLTAARAVAPPIGMLIVCTIPVVPRAPCRGAPER